ncbi:hypothetical protein AU05_09230 [Ectopseudomonas composti]|uniref:Transposase n=1 Tax=Ectopseudomonas composti TaxID=658457 RepID=A0ABN0SE75_9GAMM|nr:hypothetical protein AU05_09230 [Pseudomonas composti]
MEDSGVGRHEALRLCGRLEMPGRQWARAGNIWALFIAPEQSGKIDHGGQLVVDACHSGAVSAGRL